MAEIYNNIKTIVEQIPEQVKLVAVSKTKPIECIEDAYDGGYRIFGENKVQELRQKYETLPKDIEWHMIGHLQTNKVKYIADFVHLIHGVDSLKLLKEINKQAKKFDRKISCLLQFHIAEEQTKFGFDINEVLEMLNSDAYKLLENIQICGVMGMATNTSDESQIRKEFLSLKDVFKELKESFFSNSPEFAEISMGMSGDYKLAIDCGSTMIRVGSTIFGKRNYSI
ncbi:MAG: YggS family pyridoxal phosphate-dependent enzyme [Marinifilaceae bacterium]|jgi:pyridoxal phosphate enzyme (YggS family)|nr:YggS family pyridoxal phosphate-dependent enzyme [Marinifilaceae bacterium]